jgi:hypothetical protein
VSRGVWPAVSRSFWLLQGMTAWPHGCFPLIAAPSCEPALRVKDRALGSGRACAGAAGVLDALVGKPIMAGQGKGRGPAAGTGVMWLCSSPTVQPRGRAGAWLRSSLRGSRGCRPRGHGAVRGGQRDQSQARPRPPGRGPDLRATTRCPCPGLLTRPLAPGGGRPVNGPARRAARRRHR